MKKQRTTQTLIENNKPFVTISGDKESRLAKAVAVIDNLTTAKKKGFSSADFVEIYNHGIPFENILKQLKIFKKGISKCNLISPATVNNGILSLSTADFEEKANFFDNHKNDFKICNFIPASGAATRMFKFLIAFLNT
jgi:hypothetical protein